MYREALLDNARKLVARGALDQSETEHKCHHSKYGRDGEYRPFVLDKA